MKSDDIEQQLSRPEYAPKARAPSPTQPLKTSLLAADEAALSYARKWKLLRDDGTLRCVNDRCGGDGTLPTLECSECKRRRLGG